MGWKPYEYYTSSPYEFFAACEGYFDKRDIEVKNLRWASYRIHQSLALKPLSLEDFWPLAGDKQKEGDQLVMTKEMYEEIKKIHKLK